MSSPGCGGAGLRGVPSAHELLMRAPKHGKHPWRRRCRCVRDLAPPIVYNLAGSVLAAHVPPDFRRRRGRHSTMTKARTPTIPASPPDASIAVCPAAEEPASSGPHRPQGDSAHADFATIQCLGSGEAVKAGRRSGVELSIVTTLYASALHLREFHLRVTEATRALTPDCEIVMVNDGSPDESLDIAVDLQHKDAHVVVIDLSRNFGHHRAMMTGIAHARGDRVFIVDCDLAEAPELLAEFDARFGSQPCDVVYGVLKRRRGGWFERVSGAAFYSLFNRLSSAPVPPNALTARLLSRRYVDELLRYREQVAWIDGLFTLAGFRQVAVSVDKTGKGRPAYDLRKKVALSVDAITNFSDKPLHLIFHAGILISALAAGYVCYLVGRKLIFDIPVDGWTSVVVSIWLLGGMTILFLGIIGIYLSKVFIETKQRPRTSVRRVYRHGS